MIPTRFFFTTIISLTISAVVNINSVAQTSLLPEPGIYVLRIDGDNILDLGDYARDIGAVNSSTRSFTINILPEKTITKNNLVYALISLDTTAGNGILKIALLRDTISRQTNGNSESPYFSEKFSIQNDTVSEIEDDAYFPVNRDIGGKWVFNNNLPAVALIQMPEQSSMYQYDSLFQKYIFRQTINIRQCIFYASGMPSALFKDLRYTYSKDSIAVYATASNNAVIKTWAHHDEYLGVLKDSADWLMIMRPVIMTDTPNNNTAGSPISPSTHCWLITGWIRKADLWSHWVKQKQQTKNFRFEISGSLNEEQDYTNPGQVDALQIINKKTGAQQVIMDIGATLYDSLNNVVQVEDCNFDGYPDIMIYAHNGGAGPNDGYNFYLYNKQNEQFEYNEALSDLPQVEIDKKNKIITSAWRDGAAHHGGEQYTFIHDTLTKISYWDDYIGADFGQFSEGKWIDGKWQESVHYRGNITVEETDIFAEPDKNSKSIGKLFDGNEATIYEETPTWFYIKAADSTGKTTNGWIMKTALLSQQWMAIPQQTANYLFAAASRDSFSVAAIQIRDKATDKVVQIIPTYQSLAYTDSLLQTGDYNADGMTDFRLETQQGDNGQPVYDYYLFDKKEHIFKRGNDFLEKRD